MGWIVPIILFILICEFPLPAILLGGAFFCLNRGSTKFQQKRPAKAWYIAALVFAILAVIAFFSPFGSIHN